MSKRNGVGREKYVQFFRYALLSVLLNYSYALAAQDCNLNISVASQSSAEIITANQVFSAGGHAFWLPDLNNQPNYHFDKNGGRLYQFADGSALMLGTIEREDNASCGFQVELWFYNLRDWNAWAALSRGAKGEDFRISSHYKNWDYYEMDPARTRLTGIGCNSGTDLTLSPYPVNQKYGFQVGQGANDKDSNYGGSTWFTHTSPEGRGDINVRLFQSDFSCPVVSTTCGGTSASLDIQVSGGSGDYAYQWMGGSDAITQDLSAVTAGLYVVQVTDRQTGCSVDLPIKVKNDGLGADVNLNVTYEKQDVTCGVSGKISISDVQQGSGNYEVTLTGPDNYYQMGSALAFEGLSVGTYSLRVKDLTACRGDYTEEIQISGQNYPAIYAEHTVTNSHCDLADGSIALVTGGGIGAQTYIWADVDGPIYPANPLSVRNLKPGQYYVTITDQSNCTTDWIQSYTVSTSDVTALAASQVVSPTNCGVALGSIAIQVSGGTGSYSYEWTGPSGQFMPTSPTYLSNLEAGNYSCIIKDQSSCTADLKRDFTVNSNGVLPISVTQTLEHTSCAVGDGRITLYPAGGSGNYTYDWTGPSINMFDGPSSLVGLKAGSYSIVIKDMNGCAAPKEVNIDLLADGEKPFSCTEVIVPECHGSSLGSIDLGCIGSKDWTFQWFSKDSDGSLSPWTGETTAEFMNKPAGNYMVIINSPCLGQIVKEYEIPAIYALSATCTPSIPTCFGGNDGAITVTGINFTETTTFAWYNSSDELVGEEQNIDGLPSGTYRLEVAGNDYCGFTTSVTTTINDPANHQPEVKLLSTTNDDCATPGSFEGSIDIYINCTGGCYPLAYKWCQLDEDGKAIRLLSPTQDQSNLPEGTYQLTVNDQDPLSCTNDVIQTFKIERYNVSPGLADNEIIKDECKGGSDGSIMINPSGGSSTGFYNYKWTGPNGAFTPANPTMIDGLEAGTYSVEIMETLADGTPVDCTSPEVFTYTLNDVPGISVATKLVQPLCGVDGSIEFTDISGSMGSYNVDWYYDTDQDGDFLDESLLRTGVIPTAGFDESIIGILRTKVSALPAGDYKVVVTSNGGVDGFCNDEHIELITLNGEPTYTAISALYDGKDISCYNANDAELSVTASGGVGPYNYAWSFAANCDAPFGNLPAGVIGNGTAKLTEVVPGSYRVLISDASICTSDFTSVCISVTQPESYLLEATATSTPNCEPGKNGAILMNAGASDCPGGPTFNYYFGATINSDGLREGGVLFHVTKDLTRDNLDGGEYVVEVIDACDCTEDLVIPVHVGEYTDIVANESVGNVTHCPSNADGSISLAPSGGGVDGDCNSFSYQWGITPDPGNVATVTGLQAGSYVVTITSGCSPVGCKELIKTITVNDLPKLSTMIFQTVGETEGCDGDADGEITISDLYGGTGLYEVTLVPTSANAGGVMPVYPTLNTVEKNVTGANDTYGTTTDGKILSDGRPVKFVGVDDGNYTVNVVALNGSLNSPGAPSVCILGVSGSVNVSKGITLTDANLSCPVVSYSACNTDEFTVSGITISPSLEGSPLSPAGPQSYYFHLIDGDNKSIASGNLEGVTGLTSLPDFTVTLDAPTEDYRIRVTNKDGCDIAECEFSICKKTFELTGANTTQPSCDNDNPLTGVNESTGSITLEYSYDNSCDNEFRNFQFYLDNGDGLWTTADGIVGSQGSIAANMNGQVGTATDLNPGSYWFVVQANATCSEVVKGPYVILDPREVNAVVASSSISEISCNGGSDGAVTLSLIGGSGTKTITWDSNVSSSLRNSTSLIGLSAGTYSYTVTDESECTSDLESSVTLANPAVVQDISASFSVTNDCQAEGAAIIMVTDVDNGSGNYQFSLKDEQGILVAGPSSSDANSGDGDLGDVKAFSSLSVGTYTLEISDQSNCNTDFSTTVIVQGNLLDIDHDKVAKSEPSCNGGSDGTFNLSGSIVSQNLSGGLLYRFLESGTVIRDWDVSPEFNGVYAGYWTAEVKSVDDQGTCGILSAGLSCTVGDPSEILVTLNALTEGVEAVASGGTGILSFQHWEDASGGILSFSNPLATPGPGIIAVFHDENGCIGKSKTYSGRNAVQQNAFGVYPNPVTGDELTLTFHFDFQADEHFEIQAIDLMGQQLQSPRFFVNKRTNEIIIQAHDIQTNHSYFLKVSSQYTNYETVKILKME